jgi:benzoyl-CoA reductase subunit C
MNDPASGQGKPRADFAALFDAAASEARSWRAATGKRIVGYLGADVPAELILAAGLLPFRIGAFTPKTVSVVRYLEMGDSDVVAQLADALLDGSYDFLDYVVIGNTPTFNVTLFHFLRESRRLDTNFRAPPLTFHETHHGESETIAAFDLDSCRRLGALLGELGTPISDEALTSAIAATNARRLELTRLGALRRSYPPGISGTDALSLIARWQMIPQHSLPTPAPDYRPLSRVMFSGSDIGPFRQYQLIERAGCTIVIDDHDWGEEVLTAPIEHDSDPWNAIAHRYAHQAPRAMRWSSNKRIASVTRRALDAQVDGVVFWISDEDQASSWDLPALTTSLHTHGIATLDLGPQPAMGFDETLITEKLRHWLDALHSNEAVGAAQ